MATRSTIAALEADGTVTAIYCHWDGYPEYNGRLLNQHYIRTRDVRRLLALGDISSLHPTLTETADEAYSRRGEDTPATVFGNIQEWTDHFVNAWCEFGYLYDNGRWRVFDFNHGEVEPDLTREAVSF